MTLLMGLEPDGSLTLEGHSVLGNLTHGTCCPHQGITDRTSLCPLPGFPPRTPEPLCLENPPWTPKLWTFEPQKRCAKNRKKIQPGGSHLTLQWKHQPRARLRQQEGRLPGSSSSEVLQFQSLTTGHNKLSINHLSLTLLLQSIHVPSWGKCSGVQI